MEFLEKFDLKFLGIHFDDAKLMQGFLEILEALADDQAQATAEESHSPKIFHQLETVTSLVSEYKRNDSHTGDFMKEIFKHLHKKTGVPLTRITGLFCDRRVVIGDLQLVR